MAENTKDDRKCLSNRNSNRNIIFKSEKEVILKKENLIFLEFIIGPKISRVKHLFSLEIKKKFTFPDKEHMCFCGKKSLNALSL